MGCMKIPEQYSFFRQGITFILEESFLFNSKCGIAQKTLLEETESFFDYGCGLGDDLRGPSALGYSCSG